MREQEQQHVRGAMRVQIVQDCINALRCGRYPRLDPRQEVDEGGAPPSRIGLRERLARCRTECPEDVALGAPTVVDLLPRTLGWPCLGLDQDTTRVTFRAHGPHLVQADHPAARRRCGGERLNRPLFSAKAGSTRSPNQVSWFRQRKPSWTKISSIRLRCIAIPFSSCR